LLSTYSEERRPVFESTARDFIEKAIASDRDFLRTYSPALDRTAFEREWSARGTGAAAEVNIFEPNYEGSPIVIGASGVTTAVGSHSFAARAGHHLAPQFLPSGQNVFDALGPDFTLLAVGADQADVEAFEAAAAALKIPLKVVRTAPTPALERYAARLVLVRPDQFVAWAGDAAGADAADILARAAGRRGQV
jgi:hypothetical protein